jgi:hypothetical protein
MDGEHFLVQYRLLAETIRSLQHVSQVLPAVSATVGKLTMQRLILFLMQRCHGSLQVPHAEQ